MSEMIERVARAICKAQQCDPDFLEPGDLPQIDGHKANGDPAHFLWRDFVRDARAAIEAMRAQPITQSVMERIIRNNPGMRGGESLMSELWNAMIDAALSTSKPDSI